MAEQRRFYWIKLKTDFFNKDTIDFLLSQKNGCEYVVLYQMLCLKTANSDGMLASQIGEMLVPYDVNKISRDTKYFSVDTVAVALELFKQLGLVYLEDNSILKIADYKNMTGSEGESASRVRDYRKRKALQCNGNVTQEIEYRDKRIEYREKEIEKEEDTLFNVSETTTPSEDDSPKKPRFSKPTVEEIRAYCLERKNNVDPQNFYDFYESKGWMVGKTHMKDWKASVRTWERSSKNNKPVSKVSLIADGSDTDKYKRTEW